MKQDIYIGVDGGGSQCKVRIENSQGQLLGQANSGPANIRLSVDQAWQSIYEAIDKILKPMGITLEQKQYRFHIGLGLAGCEATDAYQDCRNRPHPFTTLQLTTDAHIACLGAHYPGNGAIIIIGTGVIGYQIDDGHTFQVGGWGFPHSDEGSGAWLGLEAIRLTLHWLDGRISPSPLLIAIFEQFCRSTEQLVTWANRANSTAFASLAPLVISHLDKQDPYATTLIQQAAQAIDVIGDTLANSATKPLPCCLLGGIATSIKPWLKQHLQARIVKPQHDATRGAIQMIKKTTAQDKGNHVN